MASGTYTGRDGIWFADDRLQALHEVLIDRERCLFESPLESNKVLAHAQACFPDVNWEAIKAHEPWLCPDHCDRETQRTPMPIQLLAAANHPNVRTCRYARRDVGDAIKQRLRLNCGRVSRQGSLEL